MGLARWMDSDGSSETICQRVCRRTINRDPQDGARQLPVDHIPFFTGLAGFAANNVIMTGNHDRSMSCRLGPKSEPVLLVLYSQFSRIVVKVFNKFTHIQFYFWLEGNV